LALTDGLNAMLHYVESGLLAARLEQRISPPVEEVKEAGPAARIKVTKR